MMTKIKINHVLLAFSLCAMTVFMSCSDDEEIPKPVAGFTFTIDAATGGIVTFTNTSQNADTYAWDFGDNTFSTLENPQKTYLANGNYTVTLTATNQGGADEATETVNITLVVDMTDTEAPVITLVGEASIELPIGESFTDPGATANDNVDGDITSNIVITGTVNTLQPGIYTLAYNVSDAAGNAATEVERTVTVTFDDGLLVNGDFEDGPTGWIGNGLDVREEGGNKFSFSNVTAVGNPFDVNVSQVLPLQIGNKYKLSFNASTDQTTGRKILAGIGLNEAPFTNVTNEFTITTTTQRFSAEFVANFGSANSRVLFDLGAAIGVVVLDNVSLELVEENTSKLPFDFENGKEIASVFNGASFAVVNDPADATNKVGKITNTGGPFEGVSFFLGTAVDFSTNKVITMRFNTPTAGVPVLLKFENGTAGPVELAVTATVAGWQDLTFDFSSATASYKQITLFVDGPGTTAGDFYIDDIAQDAGEVCPAPPADDLVSNGGFETGSTVCWTSFAAANNGTFEATNTQAKTGTYSGLLVADVPSGGGPASFPVVKAANIGIGTITPNKSVTVTFDLYGSVAGAGGVVFVEFFSELSGGGTSSAVILGGGPLFPTNTWTSYSFTTTTGNDVSGGVTVQLKADCGANPGCRVEAFFDNVSVKINP